MAGREEEISELESKMAASLKAPEIVKLCQTTIQHSSLPKRLAETFVVLKYSVVLFTSRLSTAAAYRLYDWLLRALSPWVSTLEDAQDR